MTKLNFIQVLFDSGFSSLDRAKKIVDEMVERVHQKGLNEIDDGDEFWLEVAREFEARGYRQMGRIRWQIQTIRNLRKNAKVRGVIMVLGGVTMHRFTIETSEDGVQVSVRIDDQTNKANVTAYGSNLEDAIKMAIDVLNEAQAVLTEYAANYTTN